MGIFEYLVLAICFILIIILCKKTETITDEQLEIQRLSLLKKEAELKHINWQISEIERLSKEKTKAIQSGDMELYKKLCVENDILRLGFKHNKQ